MKTFDLVCLSVKEVGLHGKAAWTFGRGKTGLTGVNYVYCFVISFYCLTFYVNTG